VYDVLVVGAGFAGSVMAERLAASGRRVLVVDRREHIGGNAHDFRDAAGVLIHRYGPHIFHTNSDKVLAYLSRFTEWRPYQHRVLADVGGRRVPMPINRDTVNALCGLELATDADVAAFYAGRSEPREKLLTSEDAVVARVGRDLYERLFRGYTRKQWGLDPSELHAQVCARIPARTNTDDRYFGDAHQCMPADGYTALFARLLEHPRIEVRAGVDFAAVRDDYRHLVWTGPIDDYFGRRYGALPYRSLRFVAETYATPRGELLQPVAVINHPDEATPYTRVTEYRHLTGQHHTASTLHYEIPSAEGDPYYPVPRPENRRLYERYAALAAQERDVTFVGRLARYQYLNMDQVVAQALATFASVFERPLAHA
jgi:UDP-galactopyranose mutase